MPSQYQMLDYDLDDPAVLLSEEVLADPRPFYDTLRRRAPVWKVPGQDTFLVADPALVRDAVGRPSDFSSNLVSLLYRGDDGGLTSFDMAPLADGSHVLATADPPVHTRHRRLLQQYFSPAAVAEREPSLRAAVTALLAPLISGGGGDAVAAVCDPFPAVSICQLIGLPEGDAPTIVSLVAQIAAMLDGVTDRAGMDAAASAALGLTDYVAARLRAAMVSDDRPDDALLAVLARAIDDSTITFDEALGMLLQLLNAGTETTTGLIARAIHTLAVEPGTQDPLRQQPARIPEFLEEVLRTRGPFQFHYRCTPTDTVLGTASIPAGSRVLLMWAAASRPHPVGTEPETDIDHEGTRVHYAFGRGIHFCIGAHLARLEARLAIEQLLAATTHIELDPDRPPGERRTIFLRRHTTLPIRLR